MSHPQHGGFLMGHSSGDSHREHYNDAIMGTISSQITSLTIVYSTVYSDVDQRKHQSSTSLAFVWGIHRPPVNSPHKWPVTRKMFPFDDVIMISIKMNACEPSFMVPYKNCLWKWKKKKPPKFPFFTIFVVIKEPLKIKGKKSKLFLHNVLHNIVVHIQAKYRTVLRKI